MPLPASLGQRLEKAATPALDAQFACPKFPICLMTEVMFTTRPWFCLSI
jgi:hypothetical protein